MKILNLIKNILALVFVFVLIFGAGNIVRYFTKEESDARYYKQTVADTTFLKNSVADTTYVKVADGWQLRDSIYFETEVDAFVKQNDFLKAVKIMGSTLIGLPVAAPIPPTGSNLAFADGTIQLVTVYVDRASTAHGVKWGSTATASFTADNFNGVGLYSVNLTSGLLTQIAVSSNSATNFNAGNGGFQNIAFTGNVSVQPGVYIIMALYNSSAQTTAPQTYSSTFQLQSQYCYDLQNGLLFCGTLAAQTALPSSINISSFTRTVTVPQIYLY